MPCYLTETSNANSLYDLLKDHEAHPLPDIPMNGNVVFNDRLMEHNTAAVCAGFGNPCFVLTVPPKALDFMR